MRLFLALDIDAPIRDRILRFVDGVRNFAPEARWMSPESLHITLKFIGEQPEAVAGSIKESLKTISAPPMNLHFRAYGFFPTVNSARVFWVGIDAGPELAALAASIDQQTSLLGIPKEDRAFSPHLTLARGAGRSGAPRRNKTDGPNSVFRRLQEKLAALPLPDFGTMSAREFYLYQSHLSPKGSTYTKLAAFGLK
jgi:2'-5' RNA ligase